MTIHGVTGDLNKDGVLDDRRSKGRNWRQMAAVKRVLEYWRTHGNEKPYPMLALPTGFGKGHIIQRLLREKPSAKILLIVGAKNILLDQSKEVLVSFAKQEAGLTDYSVFPITTGKVVLATWQGLISASRRHGLTELFGRLVIVDEGHNTGTWKRLEILKELKPAAVVGLTATAYRSSGPYKWPNEYGFEIVDAMPLPECIMEGWLSPMAGIAIDTKVLLPKEVRDINGLNYRRLNKALRNHPHLFERIATEIGTRFLPSGMKTVIIVNRINQEACVMARILKRMGFSVGLAVNQTKANELREEFVTNEAIGRYKLPPEHPDSIQVLISPQVIGEGFDAPMTECVVWAAPTMSALRYTQVVGRGTRICPGKKFCLIVDFVYMIESYGYCYNFAQFMPHEFLHELPGGLMYIGPDYVLPSVQIPPEFTQGGDLVSVFDLVTPFYPPAGDWVNMLQIGKQLGKSNTWVEKRIPETGVTPETRMGLTGPRNYYPPVILTLLRKKAEEDIHGGEWKTENAIASELGIDKPRIRRLIKDLGIRFEIRLSTAGGKNRHYAPEDVDQIREAYEAIPRAGDWFCLEEIAESLGRIKSTPWVQERLDERYGNIAEIRLTRGSSRRETYHYPPEAVTVIRELQNKEVVAGTWLNRNQIAEAVNKSAAWTQKQLDRLHPNIGENRIGKAGAPSVHYPPETVAAIRKIAEEYPEAGEWKTLRQMATLMGRSEKWVREHVIGTEHEKTAEKRVGRGAVIALHFPLNVLEALKKESGEPVPPAGDWLSPTQIAELIGRDQSWVQFKLKEGLKIAGEKRIGRSNRILPHYPPSVLDLLR